MIENSKDIYKRVAEKNQQYSLELIESIGNVVFQHLRTSLNDPSSLAYEVPELGTYNLRFKRFETLFNWMKNKVDEGKQAELPDPAQYELFTALKEKIDEYRNEKQEIKTKRNEHTQTLQSSEDQPKEH